MANGLKNRDYKHKITLVALLLVTFMFCPLQDVLAKLKVPEKIIHHIDSLYPGEKQIEWSKYRATYKADFFYNELSVSVTFDRDAHIIRCIEEIGIDKLPEKIAPTILRECEGYKILFILLKYNRGRLSYELEIMKGRLLYIIDFNEKGYVIDKSTVEKETLYPIIVN